LRNKGFEWVIWPELKTLAAFVSNCMSLKYKSTEYHKTNTHNSCKQIHRTTPTYDVTRRELVVRTPLVTWLPIDQSESLSSAQTSNSLKILFRCCYSRAQIRVIQFASSEMCTVLVEASLVQRCAPISSSARRSTRRTCPTYNQIAHAPTRARYMNQQPISDYSGSPFCITTLHNHANRIIKQASLSHWVASII